MSRNKMSRNQLTHFCSSYKKLTPKNRAIEFLKLSPKEIEVFLEVSIYIYQRPKNFTSKIYKNASKLIESLKYCKSNELCNTYRKKVIPISVKPAVSLMKFLTHPNFEGITTNKYPKSTIELYGGGKIFISYNTDKDLPNTFFVTQEVEDLGIDKELNLDYNEGKEYFLTIANTIHIKNIYIQLSEKQPARSFYNADLGYTWNITDIMKCYEYLLDKNINIATMSKDEVLVRLNEVKDNSDFFKSCKTFIKNNDYKKLVKPVEEKVKVNNFLQNYNANKMKECQICLLMNKEDATKCIACESSL